MAPAVLSDMAFIDGWSEGDTAPLLTVEGVPFSRVSVVLATPILA